MYIKKFYNSVAVLYHTMREKLREENGGKGNFLLW